LILWRPGWAWRTSVLLRESGRKKRSEKVTRGELVEALAQGVSEKTL
jgi:hypothetical protein